ncbi:YgiQ family radical SAM protein [Limihaloglobus sulfuriphilus]|uniref:YgiQ family radical SAM protein n=1 Tax=Limihaloglobus sulfuriphilus TaxID=1851148 RepID=UPI001649C177|nr:YgiQ family radical SAM protein [Limihaloglobus sulfuriphilus]
MPTTRPELKKHGRRNPDIILVTADAYVDHPSFGAALIGRYLESLGFSVAILDQPDWRSADDFRSLGRPRLFWGITSGAVDSRLNNYASMGHRRKKDVYSPGGKTGIRPDKPLLSYAARAREAFADVPIILGGLEASLRRLVHYDYIEDRMKRSSLTDAKADMLVFGMGELAIAQIARRLDSGESISDMTDIAGTAFPLLKSNDPGRDAMLASLCATTDSPPIQKNAMPASQKEGKETLPVLLPSLQEQTENSELVMTAQLEYQKHALPGGKPVVQEQNPGWIQVNPPMRPLTTAEMDALYELPFTRRWHPKYDALGGIPALEPVKFSILSHRGCFGGCSFCSIFFHQGKEISSRSQESILAEAESFTVHPDFKGTIQDVGGPSANMYRMGCTRKSICRRPSCIFPNICPDLNTDHKPLISLLQKLADWKRRQKKKSHVFVSSGIRSDLANLCPEYIDLVAKEFVSGHLKVAPEHTSRRVLNLMGKPGFGTHRKFEQAFAKSSAAAGKKQYLVPYFISSHPGCGEDEALELAEYLIKNNLRLRQVQDFTPGPLAMSTAMFVSGLSPEMKRIFVARGRKDKKLQASLIQYFMPENAGEVAAFLKRKRRHDLLKKIPRPRRR